MRRKQEPLGVQQLLPPEASPLTARRPPRLGLGRRSASKSEWPSCPAQFPPLERTTTLCPGPPCPGNGRRPRHYPPSPATAHLNVWAKDALGRAEVGHEKQTNCKKGTQRTAIRGKWANALGKEEWNAKCLHIHIVPIASFWMAPTGQCPGTPPKCAVQIGLLRPKRAVSLWPSNWPPLLGQTKPEGPAKTIATTSIGAWL